MIRPAPPPRPGMDPTVVSYGCAHAIAAASLSPPFRGEREGPARVGLRPTDLIRGAGG
jgi:hypothetical protein